jgi:hypothetical protein
MDEERQQKTDANTEKKRIIQIQTGCPGWFALFEAFEYSVKQVLMLRVFCCPYSGMGIMGRCRNGQTKG